MQKSMHLLIIFFFENVFIIFYINIIASILPKKKNYAFKWKFFTLYDKKKNNMFNSILCYVGHALCTIYYVLCRCTLFL